MKKLLLMLVVLLGVTAVSYADIETGLIAHYDFEGLSGTEGETIVDRSGNGHNGESKSDTTTLIAPIVVEGPVGDALDFDNGNYIEIVNHVDFNVTTTFSLSLWTSVDSMASGDHATMFCCADQSWRMSRDGGNSNVGFHCSPEASDWGVEGGTDILTPKRWVHLVGTFDNGAMTLYVDGVVDGTADKGQTAQVHTGDPVTIGAQINNGELRRRWDGQIDEVRFYNRALSAEDAQELYAYTGKGATTPSPENGAENVAVDTVLSWELAGDITDPTFEVIIDGGAPVDVGTDMTYDPAGLANGTEYTWQVITSEPNDMGGADLEYASPVWSFTTIPLVPVITMDPENNWVFEGESAEFSIAAEVVGDPEHNITYQWYLGTDPIVGETAATLTIDEAAVEDIGIYFCMVTGDAGDVDSTEATLNFIELLGHWPLDGNSNDVSGFGNDGVLVGNEGVVQEFDDGIIGQAAKFSSNGLYEIDDPNHFNQANSAITVYCWIKTPSVGSWNPYVARHGEGSEGWQLRKRGGDDTLVLTLRGTSGDDDPTPSVRGVYNDEWHQCVGTYDGVTRKIYLDGTKVYEQADTGVIGTTVAKIAIGGRSQPDGSIGNYFGGLIDDVRIYMGPLSELHIARMFTTETGVEVCTTPLDADFSGPIGVPDCIVDLYDFAYMAESWLDSTNIDPEK